MVGVEVEGIQIQVGGAATPHIPTVMDGRKKKV